MGTETGAVNASQALPAYVRIIAPGVTCPPANVLSPTNRSEWPSLLVACTRSALPGEARRIIALTAGGEAVLQLMQEPGCGEQGGSHSSQAAPVQLRQQGVGGTQAAVGGVPSCACPSRIRMRQKTFGCRKSTTLGLQST